MRIDDLRLRPGESEEKLVRLAAKKLRGCSYIRILKKSLDARDKSDIRWVYSVEADRRPIVPAARAYPAVSRRPARVIVAGSGPAGLFCAVRLLRSGIRPLVVERGGTVEERAAQNERFFREHILDEDCNVQFGEGGAGTFSDGKLNTQTRDARNREVLDTFVEFGAPPEVAYLNKPHVGSDRLRAVVRNMRRFILENGGEVRFHCRLEDVVVRGGALRGVVLRDLSTGREERADASELVLAIGHSARDTFRMLCERGFSMQAREFAVGVRIEHLQANIDLAQYGRARGPLPVADYKLVSHAGERTAFTFCMCPGGYVMPAASEAGGVVTNGMSNYARDAVNANSALLAQVRLADFDRGHVLDGVAFQRALERAAFRAGGETYAAPVQRVEDFLCGRASAAFGEVLPSYAAGTAMGELGAILPACVASSLRAALTDMDRRLRGFAHPDALLTGVETRFSSPVRILRGPTLESVSAAGVYPCGEGCGYSGGITSSAADGIRVAEAICAKYAAPVDPSVR